MSDNIVLEDQVLDHLVIPESAMRMWKEKIDPTLMIDNDGGIAQAVSFVFNFIEKHGEVPSLAVFSAETGYEDFQEPEAPIDYVLDKLRERYQRRELKAVVKKMTRQSGTPGEALSYGFHELARIQDETRDRSKILDSSEIAESFNPRYEDGKHRGPGVSLGFGEVDDELRGLEKNNLYFVIARPKRYKSWMLMKSAVEALKKGESTMFFTLEMSAEEMLDRMACMVAGVSWDRYTHYCLTDVELDMINVAAETFKHHEAKLHLHHLSHDARTVPSMVQIAKEHDVKAIYIDQLSFITPSNYTGAQWQDIQIMCRQWKDATEHWPVYVAAQANREAASLTKMADLSNIGLSDAIGQTADMLLGMHMTKDMRASGIVEFGTMDARKYTIARWHLKCDLTLNSNFRIINRVYEEDDED